MRDIILQQALTHKYGALVSILNPLVEGSVWRSVWLSMEATIQQVTQLVAELGETDHLWNRCNILTLKGTEVIL